MPGDYIDILARIHLFPTAQGGRETPLTGSYRPNHNFFGPENRNMTMGFIEIPAGQKLHPGDTIDLPLTLWNWPGLDGEIRPGREWRIQEGAQVVGTGMVLQVVET